MPQLAHKRQRLGRFALRTIAADACRYTHTHPTHAELDCPRCAQTIRTSHLRDDDVHLEGGPLHAALLDHLFHDCPAIEATR